MYAKTCGSQWSHSGAFPLRAAELVVWSSCRRGRSKSIWHCRLAVCNRHHFFWTLRVLQLESIGQVSCGRPGSDWFGAAVGVLSSSSFNHAALIFVLKCAEST